MINDASAEESSTPTSSKHTRLHPVDAHAAELLYRAAVDEQIPWQWRGRPESPDAFRESLWSNVLSQYVIVHRQSGQVAGLVQAYGANFHHRFCYLQVLLLPPYRRQMWPLEGVLLFLNRLFVKYSMRKVYAEGAADHFIAFSSGDGRLLKTEGRFTGHLLLNGLPQDSITLAITRERWAERGRPYLAVVLPPG